MAVLHECSTGVRLVSGNKEINSFSDIAKPLASGWNWNLKGPVQAGNTFA